jgi:hypothetical protein
MNRTRCTTAAARRGRDQCHFGGGVEVVVQRRLERGDHGEIAQGHQ